MSHLNSLKKASSLSDLAKLLGFKPAALSYALYKIPNAHKYTKFEIGKRSGGKRQIQAPDARIKSVQRRLANLLYLCTAEIEHAEPRRKKLSHGFCRGRSIITNAKVHRRRRYVFNVDIENFFPSLNFGRVRGFFLKDKNFQLHKDVATIIAQIACFDNALPQGSPCSPVISNYLGHIIDCKLVSLAKKANCTYSRYVDDITFSTNQHTFPPEIAREDPVKNSWLPGNDLVAAISASGFKLNCSKTRMQLRGSRQLATGLLVNEKVNVRPEYYRTVRAMCASLFGNGEYYRIIPATLTGGKPTDAPTIEKTASLHPLEGMLSHIYHVRNSVDTRSTTDKKKNSTATRRLYHKFVHYKNFIANDRPIVLTEGKTDQIYIRSAIEKLTKFHPRLGELRPTGFKHRLRFFKFGPTAHDLLQLGGGTGDLKYLILNHKKIVESIKHTPMAHPVILIIDNDDGAKEIFGVMNQLGIKGVSHSSSDSFYRLHSNLYLIKTPLVPGKPTSCIEDFFDTRVLGTLLNGKKFNPNKPHGDTSTYGKAKFAEEVVRPNKATIDFNKFDQILSSIVDVLDEHY